ncbi:putative nuclease HARBI1 [Photinus pyralis]|uniref:putative nuclease HARBI1 n=1 Tax=Photinus pyralis TaxID=7054 RepID=UPI0012677515|nr:putative nuclease HARBI1 [Photinus pyralis]
MDEDTYLQLLSLVAPLIKRKDNVMREAIPAHERLTATLRFLATGRTYEDLKFSTIISPQALSYIIPETCEAIWEVLHKDFMKFPRLEQDWRNISQRFQELWNFPHCLGAIDGKHVSIIPPSGSGSYYYNYKGFNSMVLLALVDANYRILMCDFGTNGRVSDGGVLQNTKFFEKLQNNLLNIPGEETIRNTDRSLPYVFIGDDAFPLRVDLMKPFRQAALTSREKKIYNYRLSRARRIVENVFGILAARFRIFHTCINLEPRNIESVVMACCMLHNFLIVKSSTTYIPPECLDYDDTEEGVTHFGSNSQGSNMASLQRRPFGNTTNAAKEVREAFMSYFTNEGRVSWQDRFIQ